MKKLLFLLILISNSVLGQLTTFDPDTVCFQTSGSTYEVDPIPGVTFQWVVSAPGVITINNGNSIIVDWSAAPEGLIPNGVTVSAIGANCPILPVNLDVLIYQPEVVILPLGPFCTGDVCANLFASEPLGTWSGVGVVADAFCPLVSGEGTFEVFYSNVIDGCNVNTSIFVTVNGTISIGPIQHN